MIQITYFYASISSVKQKIVASPHILRMYGLSYLTHSKDYMFVVVTLPYQRSSD